MPVFMTAADREEAAKERTLMEATGRAMDFMGAIVLSWAKGHPDDARVPEALHRLIRGTRVTCEGERETEINQRAFRLLHSRYRNTIWAKRTRVL